MMLEIEGQLEGQAVTHAFVPVGVGSFAQAVTSHFRQSGSSARVIGVEPDTAACLWKSLKCGRSTAINTVPTIMAGLDCGSVSTTAWPILSKGLCASMTVSDFEAHSAAIYLQSLGVSAGPCGGSTIAALRRPSPEDKRRLEIDSNSVIVLPLTEGWREYDTPLNVTTDTDGIDTKKITQALEQTDSAKAMANYIVAWLEHRDIETHWGGGDSPYSDMGTWFYARLDEYKLITFRCDADAAELVGLEDIFEFGYAGAAVPCAVAILVISRWLYLAQRESITSD
jgi:hypothetical protein